MAAATLLDRLIDPLDAARRTVFLASQRVPVLGTVLARRDLRVMAQTSVGVMVSFALTMLAPGLLLVLGPVALGVPHVAADVRFLVLRRDVPRVFAALLFVVCALLAASRIAETIAPALLPFGRLEVSLGWGACVLAAVYGGVSARAPLRALALLPPLVWALLAAASRPDVARLLFAYAHNIIAIALWAILYRRSRAYAAPALTLLVVLTLALLSGVLLTHVAFASPWGERLVDEAVAVAPAGMSQRTALGVGVSYVFLQAVHYAVWLLWVPQEDLPAEGTTTFRMSARSLVRDFGRLGLAAVTVTSLLVLGAAFLDVHRTRFLYLSVATFHGYLEVAALAFFLARGRLPADDARALARRSWAGSRRSC